MPGRRPFGWFRRCVDLGARPTVLPSERTGGSDEHRRNGAGRDRDRRRGPGGPRHGVLPAAARSPRGDPGRLRASGGRVANALGFAPPVHGGSVRFPAGSPFPRPGVVVPHEGRDGRLPRDLRVHVRARRADRDPRGIGVEGRRPLRDHDDTRTRLRGRQRHRGDGGASDPEGPLVRRRARSLDRPAPFRRVPRAVTAPGRRGPLGGRGQLGSRHRARGRAGARHLAGGQGDGTHPRADRAVGEVLLRPDPVLRTSRA